MVVVCYVDHVVGVHGAERCETISDDGKEGDQNAVDDVDNINLLSADIDPADQEQHPCKAEQSDEGCVERDEEAQCCRVLVTRPMA